MSDHIYSKPKNAAKEVTKGAVSKNNAKAATANGASKGPAKARENKKKSGRAGRPAAKTAEELDAEMQDYFGSGEANRATVVTTNGAQAVATNGGDTGMEDEVL